MEAAEERAREATSSSLVTWYSSLVLLVSNGSSLFPVSTALVPRGTLREAIGFLELVHDQPQSVPWSVP